MKKLVRFLKLGPVQSGRYAVFTKQAYVALLFLIVFNEAFARSPFAFVRKSYVVAVAAVAEVIPWYPEPQYLSWSGTKLIGTNSCKAFDLSIRDSNSKYSDATSDVTINLSGGGSGIFHSNSSCSSSITSVTISTGTAVKRIYYTNAAAETNTFLAEDAASELVSKSYTVKSVGKYLKVTGPSFGAPSTCLAASFTIDYLNGDGTQAGSPISVNISGYEAGSGGGTSAIYNASSCGGGNKITPPVTVSGTGTFTFWLKTASVANDAVISFSATGVDSQHLLFKTNTAQTAPTRLVLSGTSDILQSYCAEYSVDTYDSGTTIRKVDANTSISFSDTGSGTFYEDSECSIPVTSVTIPSQQNRAKIYYSNNTLQTATITATASGLTSDSINYEVHGAISVTNKMATSARYACYLKSTGLLRCWGFEANNQPTVRTDGTADVIDVSLSGSTTPTVCVIFSDNTVKCAGANTYGQVGIGTNTDVMKLTAVSGITNATQIALGGQHSCVILTDQTVKCWGRNFYGQLGNASTTDSNTPVTVSGINNAIELSAGNQHTCALLSDATVKCWGYATYDYTSTPTSIAGLTNVSQITSATNTICAKMSDSTIKCWGEGGFGELGDGNITDSSTPVSVSGISNAAQVVGTYNSVCARLSTKEVKCWGRRSNGAVGDGDRSGTTASTPVSVVGIDNAVLLGSGVGGASVCALTEDPAIYCWGKGADTLINQGLAKGSEINSLSNVAEVAPGESENICVRFTDGTARCWGDNYNGQLGNNTVVPSFGEKVTAEDSASVSGLSNVAEVTTGNNFSCARLTDNTVKCWGLGTSGQLGNGTTTTSSVPVSVSGLSNVAQIGAGDSFACALLSNQTVKCWGSGTYLGDGVNSTTSTPVTVSISGVTALSVGYRHTCALLSDNTVKCWGSNTWGQIGNGTNTNATTPATATGLSNIQKISAGTNHSCAVDSSNDVYCWGYGIYNSLGAGYSGTSSNNTPKISSLSNVVGTITDIQTKEYNSCIMLDTSEVWCVGVALSGVQSEYVDTFPLNFSDISNVKMKGPHACVLHTSGKVSCNILYLDLTKPHYVYYVP